jgi:hypothetical protein
MPAVMSALEANGSRLKQQLRRAQTEGENFEPSSNKVNFACVDSRMTRRFPKSRGRRSGRRRHTSATRLRCLKGDDLKTSTDHNAREIPKNTWTCTGLNRPETANFGSGETIIRREKCGTRERWDIGASRS